LFHSVDENNLLKWKQLKDSIFETNLLQANGVKLKTDKNRIQKNDDGEKIWTTKQENQQLVFEYSAKKPFKTNIIQLGEYIKWGQRVENFELQILKDKQWITVTTGTTVGYKRIVTFPEVTTNQVRIILNHVSNHLSTKSASITMKELIV